MLKNELKIYRGETGEGYDLTEAETDDLKQRV